MIEPSTSITFQGVLLFVTLVIGLWTIMGGLLNIYREVHNTRILVNVVCKHLGIDPNDILGK